VCLDCSIATRHESGVKHGMTERTLTMLKAVLTINQPFQLSFLSLCRSGENPIHMKGTT
jgi:hypothetical protein